MKNTSGSSDISKTTMVFVVAVTVTKVTEKKIGRCGKGLHFLSITRRNVTLDSIPLPSEIPKWNLGGIW